MGDTILLALSTQEKALVLGERASGTTLFDIAAAFSSIAMEWIWAVVEALNLPPWLEAAIRCLLVASQAQDYINGVIHGEANFRIERGIRQGWPTSGSIWALIFDPIVRWHIQALSSPHASSHDLPMALQLRFLGGLMGCVALCRSSWKSAWRQD